MIDLCPPVPSFPRALLDARGGFLWWYLDLVDEQGDGLVLIWSFGLPFLPGYTYAARYGQAPAARTRPAVVLSVYKKGLCDFYLFQEYTTAQGLWEMPEKVTIGQSVFESTVINGMRNLTISLDMAVPRMREHLTGTITVVGPSRVPGPNETTVAQHHWSPLTAVAKGDVDLRQGTGWAFKTSGRAYHDRNGSLNHVDSMGIKEWFWARVAFPDYEAVIYELTPFEGKPRLLVMRIEADGTTNLLEGAQLTRSGTLLSLFGPKWNPSLSVPGHFDLKQTHVVEDSNFYLRMAVSGKDRQGATGRGWAETLLPHEIDADGWRPFVAMAVHPSQGRGSMMLPLFSGPRSGRLARLFRG